MVSLSLSLSDARANKWPEMRLLALLGLVHCCCRHCYTHAAHTHVCVCTVYTVTQGKEGNNAKAG